MVSVRHQGDSRTYAYRGAGGERSLAHRRKPGATNLGRSLEHTQGLVLDDKIGVFLLKLTED